METSSGKIKSVFVRAALTLLAVVMTSATAWAETIELTSDSTAVTLYDGDVLTGTGGLDTYITIADGATVTLSGVKIETDSYHKWVGICCAGDAVIILADGTTNDIMSGYHRPAIFVPTGKTVTIRGTGSLIARGNGAAGIGCGDNSSCGNIVIEGGNITAIATGGAGIGGAYYGTCGNITITGGTVNATGSSRSAGIGCGNSDSHCGRITITSGVTSVTATANYAADAIGLGDYTDKTSVSSVIIDNVNVGRIQQKTFTYNPSGTGTTYTIHFDKNNDNATGTMADQQFTSNRPKALSPCAFTLDEHHYCNGWNTKADGSGLVFLNEQGIINMGDMTLYAQWKAESYAITYVDAVDGKDRVANTNPTSYDYDSPDITLVEPTRTGYEFDGWTWDGHDTPTKTVTIPHNSEGKKTFTAHWSYITQASIHSSLGDITLFDGQTLSGTGGQKTHVTIADGATVTLSGVNITGFVRQDWAGITCEGDATIILADGTSNAVKGGSKHDHYPGIYVPKGKTLTIRGNGSLTATGARYAAGIGGAKNKDCGNIIIEGGNITAIGNKGAAGIGGGRSAACGTITINGGTVNATGGEDAAGIGGGMSGSCGTITINGGNITATTDEHGGTGIGSGYRGTCVGININGGTINATAGNMSAGIGSGASNSYCGDINITAGTVIATGGNNGAGIGSGNSSICKNINILGGNITVTGGLNAAGIGCGKSGSCDNINISNCTVTATGGQKGVGIGSGRGSSRKKATCGDITITRTVTSVTATKGEDSPNSIGAAEYGTCGIVNIGGVLGVISDSPYTYVPSGNKSSTVHFNANGGTGSMTDWPFTCTGTWQSIPVCTITAPDGYLFAGWNLEANSSGTAFKDGQQILDIGNMTLYAHWVLPVCTLTSETTDVTLENGQTLTGTGGKNTHVTIADGATVTLNCVDITKLSANKWAGITCEGDATIILTGDNTVKGGDHSSGIYVPEGKTLTISGSGSLSATGDSHSAGIGSSDGKSCGNITIEGGSITATSINGAGIGGSQDASCGNITIGSGVTSITATGDSYNPGIGSGYGADVECGNITINGGVITATGIVGIGSGDKASCGNITINGGTVTATGIGCGKNASCGDITIGSDVNRITATGNSNSAGIGGAYSSSCGTITIKGGTIEATGSANGAGIGTGSSGTCEDIIIEGGIITATGGKSGSGIGTGSSGTCGDITIMGGTVTATGGRFASGIGSSYSNSSCGDITIMGGTVTATGGQYSAGIGSGYHDSCGEINILEGVTSVTATKGEQSPYIIGAGKSASCDEVTVDLTLNDITIGDTRTITKAEWTGTGDVDEPYIIRTRAELLLMAERVNSGKGGYAGKYYELGADIDFVPSVLNVDNDEDDSPESNFPGIGYYIEEPETIRPFTGHFDGRGHTISGIRLDKSTQDNVALFGWIGMGGVVTDVTLADAFIAGYNVVGGIAGINGGTITNCRVKNDVTVQGIGYHASEHGGVAGNVTSMGKVTDCTSAATLDISGATMSRFVGGVTGYSDGLLARNLVLGATVPKASDDTYGAIAGYYRYYAGDNKLDKNYYSGCTVAKTKGAAGVGIGYYSDGNDFISNADITDGDGAVSALRDDAGNATAIGKIAALPESFGTYAVSLAERTLWKDGAWNTLCLPFEVSTTDSPLAGDGVEAMMLNTTESKLEGGTLTLNFDAATVIPAGTPFIIRWNNTGATIENPVFEGVTVNATASTPVTSNDNKVSFVGSYSPVALTPNDMSNLFLGEANTLYYPNDANNADGKYYVNACRAYFHIDPTATVKEFKLNFGEEGNEVDGVNEVNASLEVNDDSWYSLDGRKLGGKPTQKGIYIVNGKKIAY